MKKRWNSVGCALCWILIVVFIFGGLAVLQNKFKFLGKLPCHLNQDWHKFSFRRCRKWSKKTPSSEKALEQKTIFSKEQERESSF